MQTIPTASVNARAGEFLLTVQGLSAMASTCSLLGYHDIPFSVEPLPGEHFQFRLADQSERDRLLTMLNSRLDRDLAGWEFHIKPNRRLRYVAASAEEASLCVRALVELRGETVVPLDEPFLSEAEWNPRPVPMAWIPACAGSTEAPAINPSLDMPVLVLAEDAKAGDALAGIYKLRAGDEDEVAVLLDLVQRRGERVVSLVERAPLTVRLTLSTRTLTLEQMRDLCRQVTDGHVMLQTVQPIATYTGERDMTLW